MKKILNLPIVLALLSGVLFYLAWPTMPFTFLIFVAFVPILWLEHTISLSGGKRKLLKVFGYTYLAFFVWNLLTTWWVSNADMAGAQVAIICNSLLMTIPIVLYALSKRVVNQKLAYASLIFFWVAWEYLHLNWSLSWPWLTVGNVFATSPWAIQWYEYTGALGGTTWVLILNIVVFNAIKSDRHWYGKLIPPIFWIALPVIFSQFLYQDDEADEPIESVEVLIIQPNLDAWAKFKKEDYQRNIEDMIAQSEALITNKTKYVFWPETAIQGWGIYENNLQQYEIVKVTQDFVKKHPHIKLITGLESVKAFEIKHSDYTKFSPRAGFYESYNTALYVTEDSLDIYHKSKFVPGAESEPFPLLLKGLRTFLDFPLMGQYAPQEERVAFGDCAPIICYESVYGEFVGGYVLKGANLLSVITNDAWWGDTEGHKQHFEYARLRAIEHRRYVTRSANTGISCVIDWNGNVVEQTKWWEKTAILKEVKLNKELTFYSQHGDYLGRTAVLMAILVLLSVGVKFKTKEVQ